MEIITVEEIEIKLTRKKMKNLRLSIHPPSGEVKMSAPKEVKKQEILNFVQSKLSWIRKCKTQFENQKYPLKKVYKTGEAHYLLGKAYVLEVIIIQKGKPSVTVKNNQTINLFIKPDTSTDKREAIMRAWYKEELFKQLLRLISKWEKVMGVKQNSWNIRQMKKRWGSCNTYKKTLLFNLILAKKPIACIELVVVHELVHLKERLHTPIFYQYMDKYLPDWKARQNTLNTFEAD